MIWSFSAFTTSFVVFGGQNGQVAGDDNTRMTGRVTLVDMETGRTCFHSELPLAMRRAFVYDYKETILVCSATTGQNRVNLQCFVWDISTNDWKVFPVTGFEDDEIDGGRFISSARLPGNF